MNIPGYDFWRLQGPDEDKNVCPVCGLRNRSDCEFIEDDPGCHWEEPPEPDPDYLRDMRDDR